MFNLIILLLLLLFSLLPIIFSNIETLHYESACLQSTNNVQLNLHCSLYEHIQIVRVIYGYTKQPLTSIDQCKFSIYDCIQEGTSENILTCNGKQTCLINLTKTQMFSTALTTYNVPNCKDFNYIQVNYICIPDTKDICDSWKDEGPIIHISHTYSNNQQYNNHHYCHCKIRSSISNGQVLLHARELINQKSDNLKSLLYSKQTNIDCKKMTYLEIATDRFERKCLDNFPTDTNALFGSGSHNFTLTYVRNNLFSNLFFHLELKASPIKKDHNVQIICNWKRRSTPLTTTVVTTLPLSTTEIISTTIPITRKRKITTISMQGGGKLSRLDLMRHRPITQEIIHEQQNEIEENEGEITEQEQEQEDEEEEVVEIEQEQEIPTTTIPIKTYKTKKSKLKQTSTSSTETTKTTSSSDDDEEWLHILSLADIESPSTSKQFLSINNRTFVTAVQLSILNSDEKSHHSSTSTSTSTSNILLIILLILICLTCLILVIYCLKVKQPDLIKRIKMNTNIAFLFCCEAGKLLFCSTRHPSHSISNTPTNRRENYHHNRPSSSIPDYQSSEYYMDETGNNNNNNIHCRTTQSIYDGGGEKSIYSIDYDEEETEYATKYDRHHNCGSC